MDGTKNTNNTAKYGRFMPNITRKQKKNNQNKNTSKIF